jgi:hypothetical protein
VSRLSSGQIAGFSIERLVHFLSLLGQDVEVTFRKAPVGESVAQWRTVKSRKLHRKPGTARDKVKISRDFDALSLRGTLSEAAIIRKD